MKQKLSILFLTTALLCTTHFADAQKTEDIQTGNLLVSNLKIDGRINDWPMPLKATNKSTSLSYTMGNDNKYLYLVIQSTDATNNRKILAGGITLSINADGKKKTRDAYSITYPVVNRNRRPGGTGGAGGGVRQAGGQPGGFGGQGNGRTDQADTRRRDSLQAAQMRTQLQAAKDLKVSGFKAIQDSLISMFNEYGIKSMANIDEKGILTWELAIPLEQMELAPGKEFAYNIRVNGLQMGNFGGGEQRGGQGGGGRMGAVSVGGMAGGGGFGGGGNRGGDMQSMTSPTDFWGKYILAQ